VNRAPRSGPRLVAERKRKRERERERERGETAAGTSKESKERRIGHNRTAETSREAGEAGDAAAQQLMAEQAAAEGSAGAIDNGDEDTSDLVLQYNTVRSYISAINELWEHQTAQKLHSAPRPHRVAIKVSLPLYGGSTC
jgi:hypothetical protein